MAFTVNYNKAKTTSTYMKEGTHNVEIKMVQFREKTQVENLPTNEKVEVNYRHINILLENSKGEVAWDTIFHNFDEHEMTLEYDERRLNLYSLAVKIPDGTNFNTIEEWIDYIKGRKITVDIVDNTYTNKRGEEVTTPRVSYIKEFVDYEYGEEVLGF